MQLFLAIAIFACSSIIIGHVYLSKADNYAAPPRDVSSAAQSHPHQNYRSLRLEEYSDPKSTTITPRVDSTISVYLVLRTKPPYSIFQTDTLKRYGTGRIVLHVHENTQCDRTCTSPLVDNAPCVVVAIPRLCDVDTLKCNYPQCKTMLIGDERCEVHSHDVRGYYSATIPNKGYLPLGPRLDSWTSFQKVKSSPQFFFHPSSKRQFAFNAIFSQSTNEGRQHLAKMVEEQRDDNNMPIFTTMAKEWTSRVNSPKSEQLHTDLYIEVLLDSVFTLAPAGHNPECYRLFEAVEAGSIPVLVKNDLYSKQRSQYECTESLHHWYDAPILVLDSWDELFPTVEKLMGNLEALDEMQINLHMWYDDYMRKVVGDFEEFMVESL